MSNDPMLMLIIGALVVLNLFQFCFWAWQVQALVNKLMSRSLFEYKEASKPHQKVSREEAYDPMMDEITELNQLIPRA